MLSDDSKSLHACACCGVIADRLALDGDGDAVCHRCGAAPGDGALPQGRVTLRDLVGAGFGHLTVADLAALNLPARGACG